MSQPDSGHTRTYMRRVANSMYIAGEHNFQLRLVRSQTPSSTLFTWPLPPVRMQPSDKVVVSIEAVQPADIVAGSHLPVIR